jgi:hypothetical protein
MYPTFADDAESGDVASADAGTVLMLVDAVGTCPSVEDATALGSDGTSVDDSLMGRTEDAAPVSEAAVAASVVTS